MFCEYGRGDGNHHGMIIRNPLGNGASPKAPTYIGFTKYEAGRTTTYATSLQFVHNAGLEFLAAL
jgi:hypothetical protein